MSAQDQGYGWLQPLDLTSEFNRIAFVVRQMMARMRTMTPVVVKAVHPGTGTPPLAGTVDVQPLVSMLDGNGNATPHGTVNSAPYFRLQGGTGAVICDPAVGDIGCLVISDRDTSAVESTKAIANPGSLRTFDLADGFYFGGVLCGAPAQYLWFDPANGITILDKNGNKLVFSSSGIDITPKGGDPVTVHGNVTAEGTLAVTGAASALSMQIGGGAKITRLLTGSLSAGGTVSVGVTLVATATITGVHAGDLVVLSNWEIGQELTLQPVTISNTVDFYIVNSTSGPLAYSISTNILVIGTT